MLAAKSSPAPLVDIQSLDQGMTLDILGVPHGQDRQNQTFTPATDLGDIPVVPLVYFHGFNEKKERVVERIGWAVKAVRDSAGQWYRGYLDKANTLAVKIYSDAAKGLARASSDAVSHLVRPTGIVGKPGVVTSWPVAYLSLMDSTTYDLAANMNAIVLPAAIKAICETVGPVAIPGLSGEVSAKAGQVFASRNRERITTLKGLHADACSILDEMMGEFPQTADPTMAGTMAVMSSGEPMAGKSIVRLSAEDLRLYIRSKAEAAMKHRGLI